MKKYSVEPYFIIILAMIFISATFIVGLVEVPARVNDFFLGAFVAFSVNFIIMTIVSRKARSAGKGIARTIDDLVVNEIFTLIHTTHIQKTNEKIELLVVLRDRYDEDWLVKLREKKDVTAQAHTQSAKIGDTWKVIGNTANPNKKLLHRIGRQ